MCEVVSMVVVRTEENASSDPVLEIPAGSRIEVLEVGCNDRIKVAARGTSGWIGLKTRLNEPTVVKRNLMDTFSLEGFEVGGQHEVKSAVMVRKAERLDSRAVAELYPGALVQILEISPPCRARVVTNAGPDSKVEGWITLMNKKGEPLLGTVSGVIGKRDCAVTCNSKVKALLEAARAGDVDAFAKVASASGLLRSKKVDINGRDVRGKTALIYAAAFGHFAIVEWLLSQSSIQVNIVDDTHRSALHHVAKMAHYGQSPDIAEALLKAGAVSDLRDHIGCTPLMFAAANGAEDMAAILLDAGAAINMTDTEGYTAIDYAKSLNQDYMVQFLRERGAHEDESDGGSEPAATASTATPTLSVTPAPSAPGSDEETIAAQSIDNDDGATNNGEVLQMDTVTRAKMRKKPIIKRRHGSKASDKVKKASIALAMELDKQDEFQAEVAAEESHDAAKESASAELAQCLISATDSKDIEVALEAAVAAGVDEAEISKAQHRMKELKHRAKAFDKLISAMQGSDLPKLEEAIAKAEKYGVVVDEIERARAILLQEIPRQNVRKELQSAAEQLDIKMLKSSLKEAKKVGLASEEVNRFKDILRQEEAKASAAAEVVKLVEDLTHLDMSCIASLREAKDKLTFAIKDAKGVGVAESQLVDAEQRRRKIHNTIEDLKGSIRVFCRARPLNNREREEGATEVLEKVDSMTVMMKDGLEFGFDAVFNPGSQEQVFEDCRDLVQSAIDGYNVTMFAYGQTGAGKTFTMYGAPGSEGTAPRSIRELYHIIAQESSRFEFTVTGSMLELYQSDIVDLLNKEGNGHARKLSIKLDPAGCVQIERLTEEECQNACELEDLLERGNKQRTVAATAMNSESSRSHLLFIIKIISVNRETQERLKGKILLCDLAGSERLKKSDVSGEGQKEAIEINKSLTALGDVIEALTSKQKQIPYRNHKLTQLMQDSLGGTAKTLMFVNCSPADTNKDETLMALKYATRAKQITNTTRKTV
jgi:ankyrin repeat protein